MSALNLNLSAILPPSAQWILPWTEQVFNLTSTEVIAGRSPYPPVLRVLRGVYYPSVAPGFAPQLYFLIGLFSLCVLLLPSLPSSRLELAPSASWKSHFHAAYPALTAHSVRRRARSSILVLLAALVLRLKQGRFWLLHRLDKTIIVPNLSVLYALCALAYAAWGIVSAVTAVRISQDKPFPRSYIGIQAGWIAPLWLGFWCETWATFSAWCVLTLSRRMRLRSHPCCARRRKFAWRAATASLPHADICDYPQVHSQEGRLLPREPPQDHRRIDPALRRPRSRMDPARCPLLHRRAQVQRRVPWHGSPLADGHRRRFRVDAGKGL